MLNEGTMEFVVGEDLSKKRVTRGEFRNQL